MYVYLSKILPLFLMPLGIVIVLMMLVVVLTARGRQRPAVWLMGFAIAMLWAGSTPLVANRIMGRLEGINPSESIDKIPQSKCMIVLGGAVQPPAVPGESPELNGAIDRVYQAARLYRSGKAQTVFVAAGNQPWSRSNPSEATLIGDLLREWGVPAKAILLEGLSRNTRENAVNLAPHLREQKCGQSLLVTSAAHLPRALGAFRAVGVEVYAVSTDIRVANSSRMTVMDFLPSANALAMTSDAARELLGLAYYRWMGWN